MTSEAHARVQISWLLEAAGWYVHGKATDIPAADSIAIREFEFFESPGHVDFLPQTRVKPVGGIVEKQDAAPGPP